MDDEDEDKKCSGSGPSRVDDTDHRSRKISSPGKVPHHNTPLPPSPLNLPARTAVSNADSVNLRYNAKANSAPNLCGMEANTSREAISENLGARQRSTSVHSDSQKALWKAVENLDDQENCAKNLIESETFFAVPARTRSTSGHSDGSRGIQGFWQQMDATQSVKLFGSDVVDMDDVSSNRVLPPPPPKRAEPSPKEHLIERERQARAERERARLRRQIALSREQERQHMEQSSNSSSSESSSSSSEPAATTVIFSKAGLKTPPITVKNKFPESVACTAGEGTDYYDEEDDGDSDEDKKFSEIHHDGNDIPDDDAPTEPLGFAMERFLTEGAVVVNEPATGSQHQDVPIVVPSVVPAFNGNENENENGNPVAIPTITTPQEDVASRSMAAIEVVRSSPTLAPAGVVLVNTSDPRSGTLTGGVIMPCGSSASSSLLSDFLDPHDNLDHVTATSSAALAVPESSRDPNASPDDPHSTAAASAENNATTTSLASITVDGNLQCSTSPEAAVISSDVEVGADGAVASLPSRSTMSAAGGDEDIADLVAQLETSSSVPCNSSDNFGTRGSSFDIDAHHHNHRDDGINNHQHEAHPTNSNITTSISASVGNHDALSIHSPISQLASSDIQDHHPGRLSEAELLTMAEIDHASIGNIPPRSLRDEGLASFSESSTGGGGIGGTRYMTRGGGSSAGAFPGVFTAFSEVTHTTVQESMSITTSAGANSRTHSVTGDQTSQHSLTPSDHDLDHRHNHQQDDIHEDVLVVSVSSAEGASVNSASSFQPALTLSSSTPVQPHTQQQLQEGDHHTVTSSLDYPPADRHHTGFLPPNRSTTPPLLHSYPHNTTTVPSSQDRSIQSTSTNGDENIVNRSIRPGFVGHTVGVLTNESRGSGSEEGNSSSSWTRSNGLQISSQPSPLTIPEPPTTSFIDGFDYDKYSATEVRATISGASNLQAQGISDHTYCSGEAQDVIDAASIDRKCPPQSSPRQSDAFDDAIGIISGSKVTATVDVNNSATCVLHSKKADGSKTMNYYSHDLSCGEGETSLRGAAQKNEDDKVESYHDYGLNSTDGNVIDKIYSSSGNVFSRDLDGRHTSHNYSSYVDKIEDGEHVVLETSPLIINSIPRHFSMEGEEDGTEPQLSTTEARIDTNDSSRAWICGTALSSVFSSVRSASTDDIEAEMNDSDKYLASGVLARAFPERFFALVVTLIVEIPVLFMISGGSERLCSLIGKKRYQLMMAFLPLSSAISGNCGLQGSTLTTRAVSHEHVTKKSFMKWLRMEMGASLCLGFSMGAILGIVAYQASGYDIAFGLTIFVAQFFSILTAGLTGTLAPLIFSFIFHSDSGKWGGPLETAIQDIIGSFAMVILSYQILVLLGSTEVEPDDVC